MSAKRLRLFAGPNGSGKSTIINELKETNLKFGVYLNADELEIILREKHAIHLANYDLGDIPDKEFNNYINDHSIVEKASSEGFNIDMICKDNHIINNSHNSNSYEASLIINFIIHKLLDKGAERISFESVMSHPSKLDILKKAKEKGYKNYLYYVSTEDSSINITRVENRVKSGGHNVNQDKIVDRYTRSLNLLADATNLTYRTFIWDNSGDAAEFILEIEPNKPENNTQFKTDKIPTWIQLHLIDKLS